jgi:hypothetical protein
MAPSLVLGDVPRAAAGIQGGALGRDAGALRRCSTIKGARGALGPLTPQVRDEPAGVVRAEHDEESTGNGGAATYRPRRAKLTDAHRRRLFSTLREIALIA